MKVVTCCVLLLFACGPAWSQDAKKEAPQNEDAQLVEKLIKKYDESMQQFMKKYREIENREEQGKFYMENYPKADETANGLMDIAAKHKGEKLGFDALSWIMRKRVQGDVLGRAHKMLAADYANHEGIVDLISRLGYDISPSAGKLLRAVIKKNSDHETRGQANYILAKHLLRRCSIAQQIQSEKDLERYVQYYGEDTVAQLRKVKVARLTARAEKTLDTVVKKYGDVESRRGTLADAAKRDLFELRNLSIGKEAPEIEGEDIFGKTFKLSEYRGKVVVLDFWGHW